MSISSFNSKAQERASTRLFHQEGRGSAFHFVDLSSSVRQLRLSSSPRQGRPQKVRKSAAFYFLRSVSYELLFSPTSCYKHSASVWHRPSDAAIHNTHTNPKAIPNECLPNRRNLHSARIMTIAIMISSSTSMISSLLTPLGMSLCRIQSTQRS